MRERMIRVDHRHDLGGSSVEDLPLAAAKGVVDQKREIQRILTQSLLQNGRSVHDDIHRHLRKAPVILEDEVLADGVEQRFHHAHPDRAAQGFAGMEQIFHLHGSGYDVQRVRQQFLGVLREGHPAADAVEQRRFQFLLQLFDLRAHVGLGIAQFLGCRSKVL